MIHILNRNFKKIDVLKHYTFWQYEVKFRDIGEFQIDLRVNESNIYLLNKEEIYYVLFDDNILGKIENIKKDSDSEYVRIVTLSGRLIPYIFMKRVIARILNYEGNTINFVKTLIQNEITNDTSSDRYIPISVVFENQTYLESKSSDYKKQITGGYVWDEMKLALDKDKIGFSFQPIVRTEHTYNGVQTNISEFQLKISAGADRRKGNQDGNEPVILSQSLSNINRTEYEYSLKDNCNVVYVAGEGEGTDRNWYEIKRNNVIKKGWEREEVFADARDIQSELENGNTMSTTQYEKLISERADEVFVENDVKEVYDATLTELNIKYRYNKDYFLGDFVTVQDDEIGATIDAQIVSYIKSVEGSRVYEDIGIEYGKVLKDPTEKIKNIDKKTKQNESDIRYFDVQIKKIKSQLNKTSDYVPSAIQIYKTADETSYSTSYTAFCPFNDDVEVFNVNYGNLSLKTKTVSYGDRENNTVYGVEIGKGISVVRAFSNVFLYKEAGTQVAVQSYLHRIRTNSDGTVSNVAYALGTSTITIGRQTLTVEALINVKEGDFIFIHCYKGRADEKVDVRSAYRGTNLIVESIK